MNFKEMSVEELEVRRSEIAKEIDNPEADLNALEEEARAIKEELETRRAEEAKRVEIRTAVASGEGTTTKTIVEERAKEMTNEEIRNSAEYIDAFANYIKTGDDSECRALLTQNVTGGQVPVPVVIEGRVRTAWERVGLMDLVRKTYVKGNIKVGFELTADGAVVHKEGDPKPEEEKLTLGVVTMVPQSIKKWITISDEAMDLGGEEFLYYIYDEITYQIAKAAAAELITLILESPAESNDTQVGVPEIVGAPTDLSIVAKAIARLSDQASDITVVMNRLTHADFISAMAANHYMFDPFENVRVEYNNKLDAYSSADANGTWLLVGDFNGAHANFPNGDEITLKFDDLSLAESDLIKIVGREYVALGIVAPKHFVKVTKAAG